MATSSKFNFIRYPGYAHCISGGGLANMWVCPGYNYYIYKIEYDAMLDGLHNILGSGYVISKELPYPMFIVSKDGVDDICRLSSVPFEIYKSSWIPNEYMKDGLWRSGSFGTYYGEYSKYFLYGDFCDCGTFILSAEYRGSNRYVNSSRKRLFDLKFGEELTYKNEDEESLTVRVHYPCWFSKSLLGIYEPMGGAKGTIQVGTETTDKNTGKTEYKEGDQTTVVYMGNISTWH